MLKISKGINTIYLGLFFEKSKTLVISDLQIGMEEMYNKQGVMIPHTNFFEVKKKLKEIIEKTKPLRIIINGDLKHEFGIISDQEWRETLKILDLVAENNREVILVKGNHDTILGPIALRKEIKITESFVLENEKILFVHGHKEPTTEQLKGIELIVIGHEHPAVTITDGTKRETYKCFLKGKYKKKELIVLPSFNFVTTGSDITKERTLSPMIKNVKEFEVYAVEKDVFYMGKVGKIESI